MKEFEELYTGGRFKCNDLVTQEGFIPISVKDKWFRSVYPEGCIVTNILFCDDNEVTVRAEVYKCASDTLPLATGHGTASKNNPENPTLGGINAIPCAETAARSRALSAAGFGPINDRTAEILPEAPISVPPSTSCAFESAEGNGEQPPAFMSRSIDELESEIKLIKDEMTTRQAGGIVITYGSLKAKTIRDVASNESDEDKVVKLRPYCDICLDSASPNDLRVVAAARLYVESYEKKKKKATS